MLRAVLGGDGAADRGAQRRRTLHTDDPDLAAAWEELESFLDGDGEAADGRSSAYRTAGAGTPHPREPLRADYATLGVAFDAPLSEVKRAYKRLMQAHHPDRFAHDPARQADATRKAAIINSAFARIEREIRSARE